MTPSLLLRRRLLVAVSLAALLGTSLVRAADRLDLQGRTLTADRTVDFVTGRSIALEAKVADVLVHSVEFSDRGRSSAGGFGGLVHAPVPETGTVLRAHFLAENATPDEWEVTFTLDFLDEAGKIIDTATHKSSWEGEAKPTDLDHPILRYVVPLIAKVRIRMVARLD